LLGVELARTPKPHAVGLGDDSAGAGALPNEVSLELGDVMEATPRHTFQVLTKRSERMPQASGLF
jgi:hypothetical protein